MFAQLLKTLVSDVARAFWLAHVTSQGGPGKVLQGIKIAAPPNEISAIMPFILGEAFDIQFTA